MESIRLCGLQFWFSLLIVVAAVEITGGGGAKRFKNYHTKNQIPEKCDLMCPGQPPLSLPPNFFQYCAPSSSSSSNISNPTTEISTTTTESSEEESSESEETKNKKIGIKVSKYQRFHNNLPIIRRNHAPNYKRQAGKHSKNRIKKGTVILKPEAKKLLFKHHKQLKERWRLDGCYVVCSDGNEGSNGNGVSQGSSVPSYGDSTSDESGAEDSYVEGEDTPVEIIYIPGQSPRPFEMYQVNNYGPELPAIPSMDFGYDPLFMEGKRKTNKKGRQYGKREQKKKRIENRGHSNQHAHSY